MKMVQYMILVGLAIVGMVATSWPVMVHAALPSLEPTTDVQFDPWKGAFLGQRLVSATAYQSGISFDSVVSAMEGGQSLSQVAESHGSSGDNVVSYVLDNASSALDEAVEVELITRSTKLIIIFKLQERMTELVNDPALVQASDLWENPFPWIGRQNWWDVILVPRLISATAYEGGATFEDVKAELEDGQSLAQIAEAHSSSGDEVVAYVAGKMQERLDEAVAVEQMSQDDADALHRDLVERMTDLINDPALGAKMIERREKGQQVVVGSLLVRTTSDLTDMPQRRVLFQLVRGKTLSQIAEAGGSDGDTVIQTAEEVVQERLDGLVADGRLTQEEADEKLAIYREMAEQLIDKTFERDDIPMPTEPDHRNARNGNGNDNSAITPPSLETVPAERSTLPACSMSNQLSLIWNGKACGCKAC
jgi:polyhydroxyalkanoate synthesis regulator phasin